MSDVNKQLLDALKQMVQVAKRHRPWSASVHQAEKTIAAAEQAQQVEPRCACGDSFTSDAVCANCLAAQRQAEPVAWQLFKQALFVGMERDCLHYLMANSYNRRDGALKAHNHQDLCQHIVAAVRGCDPDLVRRYHEDDYQAVHDGTQALTSYLDEVIGFPLDSRPDYGDMVPKFFDKFFELAMAAMGVSPAAQQPAVAVAVPDGSVPVPLGFLQAFHALAHNYSLQAQAPDHYAGTERDAFSDAYARCGSELAKLRAMLAAAPQVTADDYSVVGGTVAVPEGYALVPVNPVLTQVNDQFVLAVLSWWWNRSCANPENTLCHELEESGLIPDWFKSHWIYQQDRTPNFGVHSSDIAELIYRAMLSAAQKGGA